MHETHQFYSFPLLSRVIVLSLLQVSRARTKEIDGFSYVEKSVRFGWYVCVCVCWVYMETYIPMYSFPSCDISSKRRAICQLCMLKLRSDTCCTNTTLLFFPSLGCLLKTTLGFVDGNTTIISSGFFSTSPLMVVEVDMLKSYLCPLVANSL